MDLEGSRGCALGLGVHGDRRPAPVVASSMQTPAGHVLASWLEPSWQETGM